MSDILSTTSPPVAGGHGTARRLLVLGVVLTSMLTIPLTITGASVALPGIRDDLDAGLSAAQWVVNGYNACYAGFLLFTGSLADVLGRRRIFAGGLALFCGSGAVGALAQHIAVLDLARAAAGIGAAAVTTGGSALLAAAFQDPRARARAFGLVGTVLGVGLAFGPTIGGALVDALGWRAVPAVPAAFAGAALLLVRALPPVPGIPGRTVDRAGAALFTGALLVLIFALDEGPALGFGHPLIIAAFAAALALAALLVRVERRRPDPMFALGLLADRRFLALALAAGALMGVLVPLVVYLPSYLINVAGLDAGRAGGRLLMLTVPTVLLPAAGAALARRLPALVMVAGPVALAGAAVLLLAAIGPDAGPLRLLLPFALLGTAVGMSNGVLDGMAIGGVPPEQAGTASGMFNTARLVTETVLLAVVGALLAALSGGHLEGAGFTGALQTVCLVLGAFAALATVGAVLLYRSATR
ncbi:MFS transporter [Actinomadura vinacea]|uniref:MFS transporter n=1 Tax=Actinomadura vinacea TaxID=115336 RepID=A0ABN3K5W1_9ACTN